MRFTQAPLPLGRFNGITVHLQGSVPKTHCPVVPRVRLWGHGTFPTPSRETARHVPTL